MSKAQNRTEISLVPVKEPYRNGLDHSGHKKGATFLRNPFEVFGGPTRT